MTNSFAWDLKVENHIPYNMSFPEIKIKTYSAQSSMELNLFSIKRTYLSSNLLMNTVAKVFNWLNQEPITICFLSTDGG